MCVYTVVFVKGSYFTKTIQITVKNVGKKWIENISEDFMKHVSKLDEHGWT